jgi:hypothetical protein
MINAVLAITFMAPFQANGQRIRVITLTASACLLWMLSMVLDNVALNHVILDIGVRYGMAFSFSLTCDGSIGSGFFVIDRHLHGPAP